MRFIPLQVRLRERTTIIITTITTIFRVQMLMLLHRRRGRMLPKVRVSPTG